MLATRGLRVCALVALVSTGAVAQQGPNSLEFSFSNPGARSLGLGGAFAGLADDATAAFANPAGLVQLTEPEVSIEGRLWQYSIPFTQGGRIIGEPTGIGLDTSAGLRTASSEVDLSGLSFLSFVYPKERWSVAFYRHIASKFESSRITQGFFAGPGDAPRLPDFQNTVDLELVAYAAAGAYRVSESFSLGLGLSYFDIDGGLDNVRYDPIPETLPDGPFGRNIFAPAARADRALLEFEDAGWGLTAGFLWQASERWQLGGFYRQGPEVDIEVMVGEDGSSESGSGDMELPDVYGLGAAYRAAGDKLTLTFEWSRVEYSSIVDSLNDEPADTVGIVLEDADELRTGVEYVFINSRPLFAVRAGAFLDPDHRIRFEGSNLLTRAAFTEGDDELHLSVGFGVAFDRLQIDAAIDSSDLTDTASLSAIWTF